MKPPDTIADDLLLPEWQRILLDERLASSEDEEGRDWEEIRAEIWPLESPGRGDSR